MVKRNIDSGFTGIAFAIIGILTLLGISTLYNDTMIILQYIKVNIDSDT